MTRYLLDTNIISNIIKPTPSALLLDWMAARQDEDLFVASLTIAEIRRGILELPSGRKKGRLEAWYTGSEGPQGLFQGRILPFDDRAALVWAHLMAEGAAEGRPRSALDMILASVAEVNDCVMVTDNERDFSGIQFFNPMRET